MRTQLAATPEVADTPGAHRVLVAIAVEFPEDLWVTYIRYSLRSGCPGDARMRFCLTAHGACRNTMRPVADSVIVASSAEGKWVGKCAFQNRVSGLWRKA